MENSIKNRINEYYNDIITKGLNIIKSYLESSIDNIGKENVCNILKISIEELDDITKNFNSHISLDMAKKIFKLNKFFSWKKEFNLDGYVLTKEELDMSFDSFINDNEKEYIYNIIYSKVNKKILGDENVILITLTNSELINIINNNNWGDEINVDTNDYISLIIFIYYKIKKEIDNAIKELIDNPINL